MLEPFMMRLLIIASLLTSQLALALPEDQYQPIAIEADSAIRNEKSGFTAYQGNVLLTQGSLRLQASHIQVNQVSEDNTELLAMGDPATFEQQPAIDKPVIIASALSIRYQPELGRIELTGNAELRQGESRVSSDTIVYMVDQQVFKAEADPSNKTPGRVQVIIPAREKTDTTATPNEKE